MTPSDPDDPTGDDPTDRDDGPHDPVGDDDPANRDDDPETSDDHPTDATGTGPGGGLDATAGGPERPAVGADLGSVVRAVRLERGRLALWAVAGLILLGLWLFVWGFVGTLTLGLFVYYVTRPVFERIHARVPNRTLAVAVSLVVVALPVLLLVGWTLVIAARALADVLDPETTARLEAAVGPYLDASTVGANGEAVLRTLLTDPLRFLQTELGGVVAGAFEGLLASLTVIASVALQAFIVLVVTFYLLRDDHRIADWARGTFAPPGGVVETFLVAVDRDLWHVYFGNILNALVTGLIAVVTFLGLNVVAPEVVVIPQPALVGLLVGAASLVPVIGIKLVTLPLGAYLLARSAALAPRTVWFPVAYLVVTFVLVDYIPDQLLRPYVSGRTLHVGAVMLAYLFGTLLFGWYGLFLGPFLLVVVFEFGRVVLPWLVNPDDAPPSAVGGAGGPGMGDSPVGGLATDDDGEHTGGKAGEQSEKADGPGRP